VSLLWQFGSDWRMLRNAVDIWRGIQALGGDALSQVPQPLRKELALA